MPLLHHVPVAARRFVAAVGGTLLLGASPSAATPCTDLAALDLPETTILTAEIPATRVEDGEVVRTRPICACPAASTWDGAGDPDDAGSFTCVSGR